MNIRKKSGITLIALVISVIVMLILAGVSLNATVGDNGIITQAQKATYAQKIAKYIEEYEMNVVDIMTSNGIADRSSITLMNDYIKQYIPSLEDNDISKFAIVNGELYYVGDESIEKEICQDKGFQTLPEDMTSDEFFNDIENKAIEEIIKDMAGSVFTKTDIDGNVTEVGIKLIDKVIGSTDWKTIIETVDNTTKATYGTGWYYVESGNTIEGIGNLKNSYIINYDTKKAVKFDPNKHSMLGYGTKLAISENLMFEISPSMIENQEFPTGNGVSYLGYNNWNEAFNESSFIFDGIDDCITIPYNNSTKLDNGFTFQFYGKFLSMGTNYHGTGTSGDSSPSPNFPISNITYISEASGIMSAWAPQLSTDDAWDAFFRFNLYYTSSKYGFMYNIGRKRSNYVTEYSKLGSPWNQCIIFEDLGMNNFNLGDDINICLTINPDTYRQAYYINGIKMSEGSISKDCWNELTNEISPRLQYYYVGRSSYDNCWHYGNMNIYGLAIYNRALSSEEVIANNNAMVSYHNILVNNGNASTGGETGGEDFDNIETN